VGPRGDRDRLRADLARPREHRVWKSVCIVPRRPHCERQFSSSVPASNGAFFRYGLTDPPSLSWDHACGGPLPPHPVARGDSHAPLQPTYGRGICAMGASLHSLLRFAPSPRARAERRHAFSLQPGGGRERERIHPESGAGGDRVSVPRRAEHACGVVERVGASEAAGARAGGWGAGGGGGGARRRS